MLDETKRVLDSKKRDLDIAMSVLSIINKVDIVAIEKSSIIMMTYNMIEGVCSILFHNLFDFLKDGSKDIKDLPKQLALTIADYHLKATVKDSKSLMEFREIEKITIPLFPEYVKQINLFSGNLDSKKIKEIAGRFGVSFNVNKKYKNTLLYIKNTRNKLAHGELRYSEACRDKTDEEIADYIDTAYRYMLKLIDSFEKVYKI